MYTMMTIQHMTKILLVPITVLLFACSGHGQNKAALKTIAADTSKVISKTDAQWKAILTPEQYHILRQKGTDAPFAGKYYLTKDKGVYRCAGCGAELFSSDMKFDSDCGWPSFDEEIAGGKIKKTTDLSYGMVRTEITCARCGAHLGHLFDDGPTVTGKRYCVNSTSIDFIKK